MTTFIFNFIDSFNLICFYISFTFTYFTYLFYDNYIFSITNCVFAPLTNLYNFFFSTFLHQLVFTYLTFIHFTFLFHDHYTIFIYFIHTCIPSPLSCSVNFYSFQNSSVISFFTDFTFMYTTHFIFYSYFSIFIYFASLFVIPPLQHANARTHFSPSQHFSHIRQTFPFHRKLVVGSRCAARAYICLPYSASLRLPLHLLFPRISLTIILNLFRFFSAFFFIYFTLRHTSFPTADFPYRYLVF